MQGMIAAISVGVLACVAYGESARQSSPVEAPELRVELLRRLEIDQHARRALVNWLSDRGGDTTDLSDEQKAEFEEIGIRLKSVDKDNTRWLKGVVKEHGWPTRSMVGKDGAPAAWLLVQHADAQPKFQRRCLNLMAELAKGEVSASNVAYLTDRVLLAEGKKQLYGTQFTSVDGALKPRPIEDEANVDKRRAAVGLPPLAEYAKLIAQQHGADQLRVAPPRVSPL